MKILFIGGTGIISTEVSALLCSALAVEQGIDLYLLNRGQHKVEIAGAHVITGQVREALRGLTFDAVVDWVAYTPDHVERDIELFRGVTQQYIFISSASAHQKPPAHPIVTESTPLHNPTGPIGVSGGDWRVGLLHAGRPAAHGPPDHHPRGRRAME